MEGGFSGRRDTWKDEKRGDRRGLLFDLSATANLTSGN